MTTLVNVSTHTVDLSTGRMLAPGERADLDPTEHESRLIRAGQLVEAPARRGRRTRDRDQEADSDA